MLRKYILSLIIGLFSIVTFSSGVYIMCYEMPTTLESTKQESSQEQIDENKDLEQYQSALIDDGTSLSYDDVENKSKSVDVGTNAETRYMFIMNM